MCGRKDTDLALQLQIRSLTSVDHLSLSLNCAVGGFDSPQKATFLVKESSRSDGRFVRYCLPQFSADADDAYDVDVGDAGDVDADDVDADDAGDVDDADAADATDLDDLIDID